MRPGRAQRQKASPGARVITPQGRAAGSGGRGGGGDGDRELYWAAWRAWRQPTPKAPT